MKSTAINKVEKYDENVYILTETESVHCYLIVGQDKALLFDCGYGYEDVKPLIREITDLPLMLVLSHGDPDHGLGSSYFKELYMHPLDFGKLLNNDTRSMRQRAYDYRIHKMPFLEEVIDKETYLSQSITNKVTPHFLQEGDVIDLGGIELEVVHTPGHSYGHIMLLDKEKKRLYAGDQITLHNIWYFLPSDEQAPFSLAVQSMEKLLGRRESIEEILSAHDRIPVGIECVEDLYECLSNELAKNYTEDQPFHSFMGDGYQHFYKSVNLIYSDQRLEEYLGHTIKRK